MEGYTLSSEGFSVQFAQYSYNTVRDEFRSSVRSPACGALPSPGLSGEDHLALILEECEESDKIVKNESPSKPLVSEIDDSPLWEGTPLFTEDDSSPRLYFDDFSELEYSSPSEGVNGSSMASSEQSEAPDEIPPSVPEAELVSSETTSCAPRKGRKRKASSAETGPVRRSPRLVSTTTSTATNTNNRMNSTSKGRRRSARSRPASANRARTRSEAELVQQPHLPFIPFKPNEARFKCLFTCSVRHFMTLEQWRAHTSDSDFEHVPKKIQSGELHLCPFEHNRDEKRDILRAYSRPSDFIKHLVDYHLGIKYHCPREECADRHSERSDLLMRHFREDHGSTEYPVMEEVMVVIVD